MVVFFVFSAGGSGLELLFAVLPRRKIAFWARKFYKHINKIFTIKYSSYNILINDIQVLS